MYSRFKLSSLFFSSSTNTLLVYARLIFCLAAADEVSLAFYYVCAVCVSLSGSWIRVISLELNVATACLFAQFSMIASKFANRLTWTSGNSSCSKWWKASRSKLVSSSQPAITNDSWIDLAVIIRIRLHSSIAIFNKVQAKSKQCLFASFVSLCSSLSASTRSL